MPTKASKSKETPAERPILGRFSSHLKIGIVGFPFCTIEPNEARVNVPDERFEWLRNLYKPKSPDEVKCWQIRRQTKAPQAAGTIHTDFEKGFICAEVMKFDDLKELGSETAVKAAGKYKQEGKTYVVQGGDIIFFKFNVSGGVKK